jgi:hypothetical protein
MSDAYPVFTHEPKMLRLHHDGLSRPLESPRLRVLSLGAGVQSSTLALMAARGEIEAPDCAIFADTQSEPAAVYRHLDWLEGQLPFPVVRVTRGSLRDSVATAARWGDGRFAAVPFFLSTGGLARRQCTKEFKIEPIEAEIRRLLGLKPRQRGPKEPVVEQWIGISLDEIQRMKDSHKRYIHHRWPLIEARMSREGCKTWLRERQYPEPPKSACTFCPYTDNARWASMEPEAFADAVEVDRLIRSRGTMKGMSAAQYVHRSLKPLDQVDFTKPDDGQASLFGFANECEGMCGV